MLPKGLNRPTLEMVARYLGQRPEAASAQDMAHSTGVSRGTARRYLEFLEAQGHTAMELRYGLCRQARAPLPPRRPRGRPLIGVEDRSARPASRRNSRGVSEWPRFARACHCERNVEIPRMAAADE
jgi:hypothetical protein